MRIKRLAALSLAAIFTAGMLTGCDLLDWLAFLEGNGDSSSVTSSPSSSSSVSRPSYDDEDNDDSDTEDTNSGDTETPEKPDQGGGEDTETPETPDTGDGEDTDNPDTGNDDTGGESTVTYYTVTINIGEECEQITFYDGKSYTHLDNDGTVQVPEGTEVKITVIPNDGYGVDTVTVEGGTYTLTEDDEFSFKISSDCTVSVSFYDLGYTIEDGGTVYKVHNADGLLAWHEEVKNDASLRCTLTADITLNSSSPNWTPIDGFAGTFDGGGHTISGLNVTAGNQSTGMFGSIAEGGTVQNLKLKNVNINVSGSNVGGIAGQNYGGTITGCMVTGKVSGQSKVGGVVGSNSSNGIVEGCCFAGNSVTATNYAGGVVGYIESGTVTGCCFAGDSVTATSEYSGYAGGVVGSNSGTVEDCYWKADADSDLQGIGSEKEVSDSTTKVTGSWADVEELETLGFVIGKDGKPVQRVY